MGKKKSGMGFPTWIKDSRWKSRWGNLPFPPLKITWELVTWSLLFLLEGNKSNGSEAHFSPTSMSWGWVVSAWWPDFFGQRILEGGGRWSREVDEWSTHSLCDLWWIHLTIKIQTGELSKVLDFTQILRHVGDKHFTLRCCMGRHLGGMCGFKSFMLMQIHLSLPLCTLGIACPASAGVRLGCVPAAAFPEG